MKNLIVCGQETSTNNLVNVGIACEGLKELLAMVADEGEERLPVSARISLVVLAAQLQALQTFIGSVEKRIVAQHRANEASKRLRTIPGIGIIGATAIAATITDPPPAAVERELIKFRCKKRISVR
jgi:transposase